MSFNIERMHKLPPEARFVDVNDFWCFPNRWVVKFLYPFSITPTQITILSLIAGLISAYFYMIDSSTGLMCWCSRVEEHGATSQRVVGLFGGVRFLFTEYSGILVEY